MRNELEYLVARSMPVQIKNTVTSWAILQKFQEAEHVFKVSGISGQVFSADLVEKIEITKDGAIIHLK